MSKCDRYKTGIGIVLAVPVVTVQAIGFGVAGLVVMAAIVAADALNPTTED